MKLETVIARRPNKVVYRDGQYSIKLFNENFSAADVLNEAFNLAVVGDTGFPVPKLEEVAKIDGKWAIISEFVDGKSLHELMSEDKSGFEGYLERFVCLQLDIHKHTASRLRHHTDKMHAKISASGLDATTRYELHTRLNGLPRHSKLCHGDFTPGNVIITPDDRAYVIDWAHATQGNASGDAARTYLRFMLAGNVEQGEHYLRLFCKKSDTAYQYVQKWLAIVAASQLVKAIPEERELLLRWASVIEYE